MFRLTTFLRMKQNQWFIKTSRFRILFLSMETLMNRMKHVMLEKIELEFRGLSKPLAQFGTFRLSRLLIKGKINIFLTVEASTKNKLCVGTLI